MRSKSVREGTDFEFRKPIKPADLDWEQSRPLKPWLVKRGKYELAGFWILDWIELSRTDVANVLCAGGQAEGTPSPQTPKTNSRPKIEAARRAIQALHPRDPPDQVALPNKELVWQVSEKLKELGLPDVKADTILRAAGRRKYANSACRRCCVHIPPPCSIIAPLAKARGHPYRRLATVRRREWRDRSSVRGNGYALSRNLDPQAGGCRGLQAAWAREHASIRHAQVRKLAESLDRFGFVLPILIDAEGRVVAGWGLVLAARRLGLTEVPAVTLTDLAEAELRALRLALNRLADDGRMGSRGSLAGVLRPLADRSPDRARDHRF